LEKAIVNQLRSILMDRFKRADGKISLLTEILYDALDNACPDIARLALKAIARNPRFQRNE
jgi:hypothetical protein